MTPRRRPWTTAFSLPRPSRVAKRGKFIRKVFTSVFCRPLPLGEREKARGRLEVDLIGAALSEFLIRHISFRASFRATNVKRNEVEMVPRVENSD